MTLQIYDVDDNGDGDFAVLYSITSLLGLTPLVQIIRYKYRGKKDNGAFLSMQ